MKSCRCYSHALHRRLSRVCNLPFLQINLYKNNNIVDIVLVLHSRSDLGSIGTTRPPVNMSI